MLGKILSAGCRIVQQPRFLIAVDPSVERTEANRRELAMFGSTGGPLCKVELIYRRKGTNLAVLDFSGTVAMERRRGRAVNCCRNATHANHCCLWTARCKELQISHKVYRYARSGPL